MGYRGKADRVSSRTGELAEGSPTLIAKRIEAVASLRLRGATIREIQDMLTQLEITNPSKRGAPWSVGQICEDIKQAREQWLQNAAEDMKQHYSRVLAELQELKKAAWATGNLDVVLRVIGQECKILGLNSAIKVKLQNDGGSSDSDLQQRLSSLTVDQLEVLREVFVGLGDSGDDVRTVVGQLVGAE